MMIFVYDMLFDNQVQMKDPLKKTSGYTTLEITDADLVISFKDVRHYTSPCNLDKFLKTWKAPAEKSIFPYRKFIGMTVDPHANMKCIVFIVEEVDKT